MSSGTHTYTCKVYNISVKIENFLHIIIAKSMHLASYLTICVCTYDIIIVEYVKTHYCK